MEIKKNIMVPVVRKACSIIDYQETVKRWSYGKSCVFIEKIIIISEEDFKSLSEDFFLYREYISKNIDSMWYDEKDKSYHTIAVMSEKSKFVVLIESEGYYYARYTAVVKREEIFNEET